MTDGISRSGPVGPTYTQATKSTGADVRSSAGTSASAGAGDSDRVELSAGAQKLSAEPGFDAAKVASIKQAIANGNYPLDARRIAESFVSLEQMFDRATSGRPA